MAQLTDDCFAFGGELMRIDTAVSLLFERTQAVADPEMLPVRQALGRILAEDIRAGFDVPPHANSAVDGYAVYHADLATDRDTSLPVTGRVAAGHPLDRPMRRGEAVRIFTGAPMPGGEDGGPETVMMQEDCRLDGDRVVIRPGIKPGANCRAAGEDLAVGSLALPAGRRLEPQDLGVAASLGHRTISVRRQLTAAVLSTGDELADPGTERPPGAIYDANRFTVTALLRRLGVIVADAGIIPDDPGTLAHTLARAGEAVDVVFCSGGMSTGEEDHVRAAVEAQGSLHFWRLAIKPGRPVALGQIGRTPFVGLPGNPVASMVTFLMLARPLVLLLQGAEADSVDVPRFQVVCGFAHKKKEGRREYLRARLEPGTIAGTPPTANRFPRDGAGILSSMVWADGLIELDEDVTHVAPGDRVHYIPLTALV